MKPSKHNYTNLKKPLIKDYCTPFFMDGKFVKFDSKGYAKAAAKYIEQLEAEIKILKTDKCYKK